MADLTKILSKSTKRTAGETLFAEADAASSKVPDVTSFEGRIARVEPILPRHLLLFPRQSARALLQNSIPRQASYHHRFVLICAWRGSGGVWIDDRCFTLEPGHALVIFPFQKHYYVDVAPEKINWLFVTFEHPRDTRLERLRSRPAVPLGVEGAGAVLRLIQAWRKDDEPLGPLYLAQLLHRLHRVEKRRPHQATRKPPGGGLVGKINSYAFQHRNRAVSIDELAAKLGFSSSHLRALFRAQTGQALGRHLRDFRLQYACSLLRGSSRRIGEIADECGYDSLFAFSRAFKHAYDCSPSRYRARAAI